MWSETGITESSLLESFLVRMPFDTYPGRHLPKSITSDGQYLYILTTRGLFKVGSGYGETIRGHVYVWQPEFYANDKSWIGFCLVIFNGKCKGTFRNRIFFKIFIEQHLFETDRNSVKLRASGDRQTKLARFEKHTLIRDCGCYIERYIHRSRPFGHYNTNERSIFLTTVKWDDFFKFLRVVFADKNWSVIPFSRRFNYTVKQPNISKDVNWKIWMLRFHIVLIQNIFEIWSTVFA